VASAAGAQVLLLQTCPGAREVKVAVSKGGTSAADCAVAGVAGVKAGLTQLKLSVRPRRARVGRLTTFTISDNAGHLAVPGARIRFAGHSSRTDASGRAKIRARLKRRGLFRAVAWKRTYRSGSTRVRAG
jgi:hypothetical protein